MWTHWTTAASPADPTPTASHQPCSDTRQTLWSLSKLNFIILRAGQYRWKCTRCRHTCHTSKPSDSKDLHLISLGGLKRRGEHEHIWNVTKNPETLTGRESGLNIGTVGLWPHPLLLTNKVYPGGGARAQVNTETRVQLVYWRGKVSDGSKINTGNRNHWGAGSVHRGRDWFSEFRNVSVRSVQAPCAGDGTLHAHPDTLDDLEDSCRKHTNSFVLFLHTHTHTKRCGGTGAYIYSVISESVNYCVNIERLFYSEH